MKISFSIKYNAKIRHKFFIKTKYLQHPSPQRSVGARENGAVTSDGNPCIAVIGDAL